MPFPRRIDPELLDELPADDPRAIRSRGDLRRINALMLQPRIMGRLTAPERAAPPRRILEIGAGDGRSSLAMAKRMRTVWPEVRYAMLDQRDAVTARTKAAFAEHGWRAETVTADAFDWLGRTEERFDLVLANLFLHHFPDDRLRTMFAGIARVAPCFAATEPARHRFALAASRMLWAIGANDVSRHDAVVSVRAGFSGGELSALWPAEGWRCVERSAPPFTHAFLAVREEGT